MRVITFAEFLTATDWDIEKLKMLRKRDLIALAFGRRDAYATLGYIELDAVGACLAEDLAESYDRKFAAQLVRVHADEWTRVVARAEASKSAVFFMIIEFEPKGGGPRS